MNIRQSVAGAPTSMRDRLGTVQPPGASTRGRLLVATPPLGDPHFDRTVVFMLEHSGSGAVGIVLNRPDRDMSEMLDALGSSPLGLWHSHLAPPTMLFVGGPVGDDSLIGVASGTGRDETTWGPITSGLGTVDLSLRPDEAMSEIDRVRIFRGYAGWGPSQLETEFEAGAWMVFDATDEDVFTTEPDHLWRAVLRRQGGRLRWIADAPNDLSAN